jgi:hypothetical protein
MPCNSEVYCLKSFWKLSSGLSIHVLPSCIFFTNLHIFLTCTKSCSIPQYLLNHSHNNWIIFSECYFVSKLLVHRLAESFRNFICCLLYMVISFLPGLYAQVFESVWILKNSYCYCRTGKMKKLKIWQEDEGMVKVLPYLSFTSGPMGPP